MAPLVYAFAELIRVHVAPSADCTQSLLYPLGGRTSEHYPVEVLNADQRGDGFTIPFEDARLFVGADGVDYLVDIGFVEQDMLNVDPHQNHLQETS